MAASAWRDPPSQCVLHSRAWLATAREDDARRVVVAQRSAAIARRFPVSVSVLRRHGGTRPPRSVRRRTHGDGNAHKEFHNGRAAGAARRIDQPDRPYRRCLGAIIGRQDHAGPRHHRRQPAQPADRADTRAAAADSQSANRTRARFRAESPGWLRQSPDRAGIPYADK